MAGPQMEAGFQNVKTAVQSVVLIHQARETLKAILAVP